MRSFGKYRNFALSRDPQRNIRIPDTVVRSLEEEAIKNDRTFNNEILYRLAKTLYEKESLSTTKGENDENQ